MDLNVFFDKAWKHMDIKGSTHLQSFSFRKCYYCKQPSLQVWANPRILMYKITGNNGGSVYLSLAKISNLGSENNHVLDNYEESCKVFH